jgi:hypothetical protein
LAWPPPFLIGVADAAGAGVAGALLAEHLAGGALDLAARLGADGALPLVGVVHDQRLLEQVLAHLAAELLGVDLEGADLLAGLVEYGDFDHGSEPSRPAGPPLNDADSADATSPVPSSPAP